MENMNVENTQLENGGELSAILKNQEDMKAEMEGLRKELKKVRGSLRTSKIINVLTLLIILALIGGGVFAGYSAYQLYMEYAEPVVNQVSGLDFDEMADTLDTLDLDEIADAIEKLQNMDISELTDALNSMDINEILDKLDEISQSINTMQEDISDMSSY